jgi:hypothetical protein
LIRLALLQLARDELVLGLVQLGLSGRRVLNLLDLGEQRALGVFGALARREDGEEVEEAHVLLQIQPRLRGLRDLLLVNERAVEARRLAGREDHFGDLQSGDVVVRLRRREEREGDSGQRHAGRVLDGAHLGRSRRLLRRHARERPVGFRHRAEILVDPAVELFVVEVADDDERRVVGAIKIGVKLPHVFERGGVQVLDAADAGPPVGVRSEGLRVEQQVEEAAVRGREHALAVLLLHHVALGLEGRVVNDERTHPLGLGPQQRLRVVRGDDLPVDRHVVAGRGVVDAAHVLGQAIHHLRLHVLRRLEHEVLEEMREAAAALGVVLRPDLVPDLYGDGRAGAVGRRQHAQAVRERAVAELKPRQTRLLPNGRARRDEYRNAGGR